MLKNILSLNGVEQLSKTEQRAISGAKVMQDLAADFPCYCNGTFKQNCSTVQCCITACGL